MTFSRRKSEASERVAERRRREDAAPRLLAEAPDLETLKLEIDERRAGVHVAHVKRVVVSTAPALFAVSCAQKGCIGGGHDVTREVIAALRRRQERFAGTSTCNGELGTGSCGGTLDFVGVATYRAR